MENHINYIFETSSIYKDKSKEEVEASLYQTIIDALHENYGSSPDSALDKRIQQEWHRLEEMDAVLDVVALYEITKWMRENGYAYWATLGGGSFIFYLLKIINANPLPPHYLCPKCKSIVWKHEYKDGFDLPRNGEKCAVCSKKMIRAGHDIPWQMYLGFKDYFNAELRVDSSLENVLPKYFESHWLISLRPETTYSQPYPKYEALHRFGELTFITSIDENEISPTYHENNVDPYNHDEAFENWEALVGAPIDLLDEMIAPEEFSDIVALSGLMHSTSAWDEDTEYMVSHLGYLYSDLICHSDDVYYYLLSHGFTEKDAWRGAEAARKNIELPVITAEMRNAKDKWVLARLEQIKYLFPKAHSLEHIYFCIKAKRYVTIESTEERDERYLHHGRLLEDLIPEIRDMDDDVFKCFVKTALNNPDVKSIIEADNPRYFTSE